jgi:predicted RNase H-like HicB family nuclease
MGPQDPENVTRDTARDLSAVVGELAWEDAMIGWSEDAVRPYTSVMTDEDTVLEEAMDNLKEAGQRIKATQSLMRSEGMTDGENYRDLLTRLSTALAMTEAAYLEARRRRDL